MCEYQFLFFPVPGIFDKTLLGNDSLDNGLNNLQKDQQIWLGHEVWQQLAR